MRFLAALLMALFCPAALADVSYWEPDVSDLWWNPAESGWGVNMIMQYDTLFATLFVYGADGRSHWYVASSMVGNAAPADQRQYFTGRLYETTGPVVTSATFDPSAVTVRDVGQVTFEYQRPDTGILTYTVDGMTVSKRIVRQTWRIPDITGEFFVNRVLRAHSCNGVDPSNQPSVNEPGIMTVSRTGNAVQISVRPVAPSTLSCTYTGTASQGGRMGTVSGTYSCSDGTSGGFTLSEIQVNNWGFTSLMHAAVNGCGMSGPFGGARSTMFEWPS